MSPKDLHVLGSVMQGLQTCVTIPGFLRWNWNSFSCPHCRHLTNRAISLPSALVFKYCLYFDDLLNEIWAYVLPRNRAVGVPVSFCQLTQGIVIRDEIDGWPSERVQLTGQSVILEQMVQCTTVRKQTEQGMGIKPSSSISPWPLHQLTAKPGTPSQTPSTHRAGEQTPHVFSDFHTICCTYS